MHSPACSRTQQTRIGPRLLSVETCQPVPLEITIDRRAVESETTCRWNAPRIFVLATVLWMPMGAAELRSQFLDERGKLTHTTHFVLGPAGYPPATIRGKLNLARFEADLNRRLCVYEHAYTINEMFKAMGRTVGIDMYDEALEGLG